MKKTRVSIVLPAYNERDNLLRLIPQIQDVFSHQAGYVVEIIIVDDDSADGTTDAVRKQFSGAVQCIVRTHVRGLATAIYDGVRAARGDIIIGMDADGNHSPMVIPAMLKKLRTHDFVVASRFISGGGMRDLWRHAASKLFNMVLYRGLHFPVYDATSGYYAVRASVLRAFPLDYIYQGYGEYHLRLVWYAKKQGVRIVEIPVYYESRQYGQSKSKLPIMFGIYSQTALTLRFFHS